MNKLKLTIQVADIYKKGGNIIEYLKNITQYQKNSIEDIMISYDFQAGSYIEAYYKNPAFCDKYAVVLLDLIKKLGDYSSILEAGVGEGTVLVNLLAQSSGGILIEPYGFDISWSRVKYAKKFAKDKNIENINFFVGDMFKIPLCDNSIDIVYTSHSIEPNTNNERPIVEELYRVCKKYLILLEPAYDLANDDAKKRMKHHGYITDLNAVIKDLNYNVLEHRFFDISSNPLNPTGLTIIEKNSDNSSIKSKIFKCPVTDTDLLKYEDVYFSSDAYLMYPIIQEIPCLLCENAILGTKFLVK